MALFTIFWYLFLAAIVYYFQKNTKCFSSWNSFTLFVAFVMLHHGTSITFCFRCRTAGFIVPYHVSVTFILNLILMYLFVLFGIKFVNVSHNFNPGKINVRMKLAGIGYKPFVILAGSKLAACGLFTCFLTFGVVSSFLFFLVLKQITWLKHKQTFSLRGLPRLVESA